MKRQLNYIFSQMLDNYKDAYKGTRPFYIGFGLLFILINAGLYMLFYVLNFGFFNGMTPNLNKTFWLYTYLLLLILPSLATLKKTEESPLKFWQTLVQNIGVILVIGGVSAGGFYFIGAYKSLLGGNLFAAFNELLGIMGQFLTAFIILSFVRIATQRKISLWDRLTEALIATILLFSIINEFYAFFTYGFLESFRVLFGTDLGEIVFIPVLFVLVNLLLSPLLVAIITTIIRYEKAPETIVEMPSNEGI